MPTRQNTLAEVHTTSIQRNGEGMHPYRSLDRFAPSISLQILNNRRKSTINSVEDIELPPSLTHRVLKKCEDEDGESLDGSMRMRSSFESGKSRVGVTVETHAQTRGHGQSSRSLGNTIELEMQTKSRHGSSHHSHQAMREESAFMQETRIPYRNPSINLDNYGPAHHPPEVPTAYRHKRSTSSVSYMIRRHRQRTSFSESFLAAPYDEEKADSSASGSPHSKSFRSPRIGGRVSQEEKPTLGDEILTFFTEIVPHQAYLHCLLRLPYLYFSRVEHIFENANLTLEQIKHMALQISVQGGGGGDDDEKVATDIPKGYSRLKKAWERFIDSLLREWKTLNIISGLLLSGILTIFQIEGTQNDPVTRYMAFWSLISALLSLLYGCIFIIRFSGMRRVYQATEWAIEAQRSQALFWNVWVMLAMPAVWLVWSILAYIACIMAFMWRVNPDNPKPTLGPQADICFKAFICCVLGVGILYAILIINTLRQYGSKMDKNWRDRINKFRSEQTQKAPETPTLSPLFDMQVIGPTPPQTYTRLSSSFPWHTNRTSPPPTTNQPSLAGQASRLNPYIPPRPPTKANPNLDIRESSNPPSPSSNFSHSQTSNARRTFSASPTPMTPESSPPPQNPRNHPLDEAPGTPETGAGTLGLIFDAEGEEPEGVVLSSGLDGGPGSNTRQRVVGDETTEPDSDTTLLVQAGQSEDSDHMEKDERVEVGRYKSKSQSLEDFRPVPSTTPHPLS